MRRYRAGDVEQRSRAPLYLIWLHCPALSFYDEVALSFNDPQAEPARSISERLPLLDPVQEVALLEEAGSENIELFPAGCTFKGWVGWRSA